ncbi:MAG TPA: DegT/DnrJ/EryC1/StrS family aminotransferase [Terriglobales bacterium]|jgi:dTDP-4-amino-4,6-dideoxygalactose transaminase
MAVKSVPDPAPTLSTSRQEPVPMLDLKRQYTAIKEEVDASVERVMTSQHFIGGPELDGFERESAEYLGARTSIGCASGTDALWLALRGCGVEDRTSVVTTPFSFFASISSIVRCGATPVLADIDPATLNLDPDKVEAALKRGRGQNIRGVMPVHLYGQCANMDRFEAMAQEYGISVVEDAAQAFGASWKGKKAGTLGKAAGFSFYPTKNLSAYGDGGCVTTDDDSIAGHVRRLRNHGSDRRYYHEEIGWNSRLDAMQAAVLRVKLKHIDDWNQKRRMIACRYHGLFAAAGLAQSESTTVSKQSPVTFLKTLPESHHTYHQFVIRAWRRDELQDFLTERKIGSEVYYPLPLHLQKCFAYLGYKARDLPESERAAKEVLALPIFPELREDEQERVITAIAEFYSR